MEKNSAASLLTSVDSLFTTQEERDIATQPRVQEIPIDQIDDFPNHPFKVRMDDSMMEMAESVKQHGILVPAIVRPKENGHYEMVAGHRRKLACTLIAKLQLPCIVRELTDEEATIIMVDSNLQREQLLPSEKAFAYKMKLDAMKRQGQRTDLTSRPLGEKLLSVDQLSNETPDSARQIHRYIRLTELIPEVLDLVDNSVLKEKDKLQIALRPAVALSYLTQQEQHDLYETMITEDCTPSHVQAMKMRKFSEEGRLICAHYMKDKPLEENAAFLQKSYGTNGAGLLIQDREYAIWYDPEGIRIATGRTVQKRYTTLVSWEQAAKRVRELLDLGRYMPQSELDRVQDFERMELAKSLIYARREFSDEARDAGYLPLTTLTYSGKGGFPEIEAQMQRLLEDRDALSQLVDEWTLFAAVYEKDRSLLRSRWYDPIALLRRLEDLQREPHIFTAADGYDPQRRFFISDDEIDRILRGSERSYESRLDTFSFFSRNTDTKERERFLKQQHGEYSGYHGGNDSQTYTSAGLSFSHGSLTEPYAHVELKWPAITKRISDMISLGRFLYPSDAEKMADYEVKQLAKLVINFFRDAPDEYARPTEKSIFDYWDGVTDIQGQLSEPERVREIYETMMLPLWNATLPGERFYRERERGMEAMQAYRAGTFSVFGRDHSLRPLPLLSEAVPPPENKPTERAFLDNAKYLIDSYCQEVFGQDADFADLSHVDLAYGSTSDSLHTVEIFADLSAFRLVYQVDKETVHEISCDSLQELNEYLVNLDFDTTIAHAEERYQAGLEDTFDDIDPEQIRENLAQRGIINGEEVDQEDLESDPIIQQVVADAEAAQEPAAPIHPKPKPKREQITFEPLYPEIPREQRTNFHITDPELGYGTASEKYAANVAAIRMLKRIEDEGRLATPVEQEILSRYVGWGGLADCFDEKHSKYQELKALLSEEEYAAARASSLTAFYTSPVIIQSMYQA